MLYKSALVTEASGSVGGITASHNSGGQYLRARRVPTDPGSGFQQAVRTAFANMSTRWGTLTEDQREAWQTYALAVPVINALGDPVILSGQQMYVRCNASRIVPGFAPVDDGPIVFAADSLSPVEVTAKVTGGALDVVFDDTDEWVDEDDAALLVYGSRQQAATINYFKGPFRLAGSVDGDSTTPPTSPFTTILNPFAAAPPNFTFSRVLSIRADGRISPVQFVGPIAILP